MKIASFNINNINRRLPNLLSWLREAEPDIVCLQDLKAADTEFPADAIQQAGYQAVWRGEKRWNGVAILARARWSPAWTCQATSPMGNAAISRRPLMACSSRLSTLQTGTPSPVSNSITSSHGDLIGRLADIDRALLERVVAIGGSPEPVAGIAILAADVDD